MLTALAMVGCGSIDDAGATRGSVSGTCPHSADADLSLTFCGATAEMPVTATAICAMPSGAKDTGCNVVLFNGEKIDCVAKCP